MRPAQQEMYCELNRFTFTRMLLNWEHFCNQFLGEAKIERRGNFKIYELSVYENVQQVDFTLSQGTKALMESRGIALIYFRPLH